MRLELCRQSVSIWFRMSDSHNKPFSVNFLSCTGSEFVKVQAG